MCNLLNRFNVVTRDELVVRVEKLDSGLLEFERSLGKKERLDSRKTLERVIVSLFDQRQFFTLRLIETAFERALSTQIAKENTSLLTLDRVRLLEPLKSENQ